MITSLYAGILGFCLIALSVNIILARGRLKIAIGDNDIEIKRKIRAQGNFIEYTSVFLILMMLFENNFGNIYLIHALGILFIAGRIMHAYSLLKAESYNDVGNLSAKPVWRIRGMIISFACISTLSGMLIFQYFSTLI